MRRTTTLLATLLVGLACSNPLHATELLVPGPASIDIEGGSSNTRPFSSDFDFGARFQQVWDASEFGSVPGALTSVGFRLDGGQSTTFEFAPATYELTFSTTAAEPGALSTTFDDNAGADETVVLSTGPGELSILFPGGATPNEFFTLNFDTPFLYDPNAGNLLMEINYVGQPVGIGSVDTYTEAEALGITSRVQAGFGGPTGFASTEFSAVVQFGFTPVPEPSSVAVCLLGLGAGLFTRRA